MGYRIVRMSRELFEALFTEGHTLPTRDGERLRVTKGLPDGAELVDVSRALWLATDEIALKFEHPSWGSEPGAATPVINIELTMEHATEFHRWRIPSMTPAERQEVIELLHESAAEPGSPA